MDAGGVIAFDRPAGSPLMEDWVNANYDANTETWTYQDFFTDTRTYGIEFCYR